MDIQDDPFARAPVNREDDGIGKLAEKHSVATLRVFGSNYGQQWVMYGGHNGGTQDYGPPETENGPPRCNWFTIYFEGVLTINGKETFGNWKMTVTGENLELAAYNVSKHTASSLKVGSSANSQQPIKVTAITFAPYRPARQED